jgi:hypothetical protein
MNRRSLAWVTMPLIFVTVGCASPLDNQLPIAQDSVAPTETLEPNGQRPDSPEPEPGDQSAPETEPPPVPEPQPPPKARGAPLDIAIFTIVGAPYSLNQGFVEDEIIKACGGTLCVNIQIVFAPAGPESLTCNVAAIDQPKPIFPGDTITFSLSNECDEGEPDGEETEDEDQNENEDVAPETATTSTDEPTP